jgi:3-isopropylmalate/(R)-2-methylmalate dehydratase small subunit
MKYTGKVWKFGDHINTDDIIAARYLNSIDPVLLASHCMETVRPEFPSSVRPGDIIVGGQNFGCGSSREHAPIAIKACGISVVVARSFARIFLRNAINIGLPLVELEEADGIPDGLSLSVDLEKGLVTLPSDGRSWQVPSYPEFLQNIISNGGLMPWVQKRHIKSE